MAYILDYTSDKSQRDYLEIFADKEHLIPEYVKSASLESFHDTDSLEKEAFAAPDFRMLPINSPEKTFVSNAYFQYKKASIAARYGKPYAEKIEGKIKQAADIFGITEDMSKFDTIEKEASNLEEEFIISLPLFDSQADLYPVKTATDFTNAINHFSRNIEKYPMDWRFKIADAFAAKCEAYGVEEAPDLVCKYASAFFYDTDTVRNEVLRRSKKVASAEAKDKYEQIKEAAYQLESIDDIRTLAEACWETEVADGVYNNHKRARDFGDCVDKFFTLPVEKVASALDVVEVGNEAFDIPTLQKVSKEIYKEAFGFDIDVNDRNELREVFATVPLSDLSLFKELSGVRSVLN